MSLWGPVPISSLPDVTAEPPRKDSGELLLSKLFLDACSSVYAVFPGGQENQGQPFIMKHFNVIDPLRVNNNLGRSVNKGNYYRIRSAFAFGAKRLARLLDCPKENIVFELNQFFMNTWERHGSGIRPDAPSSDLWRLRPSNQDHALDNQWNASGSSKKDEKASIHEIEVEGPAIFRSLSSRRDNYPVESTFPNNDFPAIAQTQGQKGYVNPNSSWMDQTENDNSNQSAQTDRNQRSRKPEHMVNESQGRYLFARTRSSPELTDAYCDASFRTRRNKPAESGKTQMASAKMDGSRRKNAGLETVSTQSNASSSDDHLSGRPSSSHRMPDSAADSSSISDVYADESGNGPVREDHVSVMGAQGMHQEEQDLVNLMASSSLHNFGGQVPMPMNLGSTHLPLPISQSVLASMGYAQRTMAGMVPANIPLMDPYWAANLQFHQGMMSSPMAQYFPGVGLPTNSEDLSGQGNKNFVSAEMVRGDADTEYWHERDGASNGGLGHDDASLELHVDERQPSTSGNSNFIASSRIASPGSPLESQRRFAKENRGSMRDDHVETFQQQDNQVNEVYDRVSSARFSSASQSGSVRSKTSSESSWDGSSARVSKVAKDKRGRKTVRPALAPSNVHGKGKNILEHATTEPDDEERDRDWNITPALGNEIEERSISSESASALQVSKHNLPGFDGNQTSGSDSIIPIAPMLVSPASRQRGMDNSGVVPFTFYPTGPPVPFLTMLPVYNFPTDSGTSDASSSKVGGEEGPDNSDSGQNFDSTEGRDAPDVLSTYSSVRRATATESPGELKNDILNSDFASHWQNLQFGRFCQGPRYPAPVMCPSPVVVPPMYLQGRFPWDGPGRPLGANVNLFPHLMNYGPRLVPAAPLQSVSNRPTAVYQQYVDELPRHRSGTGTYLPNPKASVRDRHSSGTRRNSYNYDRSDHADREGNWNTAKARAAARSHNRNQADKSRIDRPAANENRPDRAWIRHEPLSSYQSQNGPVHPIPSQSSSATQMAYGMYQLPGMNPSGITSNGQSVPSVVMLYPYDHNSGYVSPSEHLEFGSLGPVGFIGMNDSSQPAEMTQSRVPFVDQRHHGSSTQHSSPDQPSSPHFPRRI